ncbi:IclR family transcriptional regulator [Demequina sp.]|uniref:IclR family transcriptional regulator n=1 Tax=Demequina sp. TaxID=2050685 RepID=UPI0025B84BC1|nr:IclR family transcriptional regulator [Demequina sp.]
MVKPEDEPGAADARLVGSDRVLALLIELARRPDGASLDDLAVALDSAKSTVHRALGSLTRSGLATRESLGRYAVSDEFLRLAFTYQESRPEAARVMPALRQLAERFGEIAHYGVLEGGDVVYRAKVDPAAGSIRLTSYIGGRNPARATAMGKAILAHRLATTAEALEWAADHPVEQRTAHTLTDDAEWAKDIALVRERGFAVDDQENEPGINCVAVRVVTPSGEGALSVSALAYRTPLSTLIDSVDDLRAVAVSIV